MTFRNQQSFNGNPVGERKSGRISWQGREKYNYSRETRSEAPLRRSNGHQTASEKCRLRDEFELSHIQNTIEERLGIYQTNAWREPEFEKIDSQKLFDVISDNISDYQIQIEPAIYPSPEKMFVVCYKQCHLPTKTFKASWNIGTSFFSVDGDSENYDRVISEDMNFVQVCRFIHRNLTYKPSFLYSDYKIYGSLIYTESPRTTEFKENLHRQRKILKLKAMTDWFNI